MPDSRTLLVRTIAAGQGDQPVAPETPEGPNIQESFGKAAPVRTYQDLLRDAHDDQLFEYYATLNSPWSMRLQGIAATWGHRACTAASHRRLMERCCWFARSASRSRGCCQQAAFPAKSSSGTGRANGANDRDLAICRRGADRGRVDRAAFGPLVSHRAGDAVLGRGPGRRRSSDGGAASRSADDLGRAVRRGTRRGIAAGTPLRWADLGRQRRAGADLRL
jgi:hypothetical protein